MKGISVHMRFSPSELAHLDELARENGLNRSDFLRQMIREGIEKFSEKDRTQDAEELKRQFDVAEFRRLKNQFYRIERTCNLVIKIAQQAGINVKADEQNDKREALDYTNHLDPDAHIKG